MDDDTFVIKANVDDEQANRFLNGIKDELMKNATPINPIQSRNQDEEETETLEEWLKEDSRLERLQEQFIQEHIQEFMEMLRSFADKEDSVVDVKNAFCEKHKEEFRAFCEEKRNEK